MWHLEKIGDFEIDFSYKVSGNYLSTGTTLMIQDFYQGSDYAEIYYDGVTRDINSFITEEMLSIMENNGLVIHKGYNLPVIEGFFNASPFVLKGSNIESDIEGETYADFKFQLFDQDRISLEAKMNYKTGDDGSGESYQTYTLGKFPYFTTFSEVESIENGENATTVIVISGKMIFEGIFDLQVGLFMLDNKGNPSGYFIDNGKGRVFYDSDRVTKYEDSYKNSKNQERSKNVFL